MRIVTKTDMEPNLHLKKVKLEGLKATNNEFAAMLNVCHKNATGFKAEVLLFDGDGTLTIELRDVYLPDKLIPKFAIDFDCFLAEPDYDMSTLCECALTNVLSEMASVIFTRDGDQVMIYLKIGEWRNDGQTDLEIVKDYLVPK